MILKEFDPMQNVPVDDEQAMIALRHEKERVTGDSLCGIYRCKRELGLPVLNAYMTALQAHVDAFEHAQQDCGKPAGEPAERTWWAGYEYIDTGQVNGKTNT